MINFNLQSLTKGMRGLTFENVLVQIRTNAFSVQSKIESDSQLGSVPIASIEIIQAFSIKESKLF